MLFLKDLNVFHIDGKEIPCITASGAPDARFPGAPGSLYMDTDTGALYKCIAADIPQETYSWKTVGDAASETIPNAGSGISAAAAALLITILQNAVFTTNQTANIAALQESLASGGASGGNTGGGSGDSGGDSGGETVAVDITVADGVMTIIAVGSAVNVADGVMTIA